MLYLLIVWLVFYVINIIYILRNWRSLLADLEIVRIGYIMFMDANKTKRIFFILSFVATLFIATPILTYGFIKARIKLIIKKITHGKN